MAVRAGKVGHLHVGGRFGDDGSEEGDHETGKTKQRAKKELILLLARCGGRHSVKEADVLGSCLPVPLHFVAGQCAVGVAQGHKVALAPGEA